VSVLSLAPPGGHSHDLEMGPRQVAAVSESDLVMLIPSFMPALDDAVRGSDRVMDVSQGITLREGHSHDHDHDHDHDHGDESGIDPHIWLDPRNMVVIAERLAERLGALQPENADQFQENANQLAVELGALDDRWMSGTMSCRSRDLVVAHEAFGYLAQRYRLNQRGISGISPEAEPSPKRLAEIAEFVRDRGVMTIYYETLIDPRVARTIAEETGARTARLDPIESLAQGSSETYLTIMDANLTALRDGNGCA
jgi:zinc transport system substrate-binding protein